MITAARNLILEPHTIILAGDVLTGLGSFSYSFTALSPQQRTGRYCSIATGLRLMGPQHPMDKLSTTPLLYHKYGMFAESIADFTDSWTPGGPGGADEPAPATCPVIGNDVWIGQEVLLGPKARLGDGCVIAARAVVTGEVPPYAIMGGVPARLIRYRFPQALREELLDLRWWEYALPALRGLPFDDPAAFASALRAGRYEAYRPPRALAYEAVMSLG